MYICCALVGAIKDSVSSKHLIQFPSSHTLDFNYLCIIQFLNYLATFFFNITHYKKLRFTITTEESISNNLGHCNS